MTKQTRTNGGDWACVPMVLGGLCCAWLSPKYFWAVPAVCSSWRRFCPAWPAVANMAELRACNPSSVRALDIGSRVHWRNPKDDWALVARCTNVRELDLRVWWNSGNDVDEALAALRGKTIHTLILGQAAYADERKARLLEALQTLRVLHLWVDFSLKVHVKQVLSALPQLDTLV